MDQNEKTYMTPFDSMVSTQQMQTIKLLLPYVPPARQRFLAVYVKFMELTRTIEVFHNPGHNIHSQGFESEQLSAADILGKIRPYMPEGSADTIDMILNILNMMDMASAFQNMDMSGNSSEGGLNPMDLMKGMLSPEQQDMFDMYNAMFADTLQKGDDNNGNGRMDESPGNEGYGPAETGTD